MIDYSAIPESALWDQTLADAACEQSGDCWLRGGRVTRGTSIAACPPAVYEYISTRFGRVLGGTYARYEKRAAWLLSQRKTAIPWDQRRFDGFDQSQVDAILTSLSEPVSVITGGPGTGKTTIARAIASAHGLARTLGLSPTGKGADRLRESLKIVCYTVHRAIWQARAGKIDLGSYKLILIDETGMLDAQTLEMLLRWIRTSGARVVFLGDPGQLPSVGPGQVLDQLIDCLPTSRLTVQHRSEEALIGDACEAARQGKLSIASGPAYLLTEGDQLDAIDQYRRMVARFGTEESRLITIHRHDSFNLNMKLIELTKGRPIPVVCLRNDYANGVMNGQTGTHCGSHLEFLGRKVGLRSIKWGYAYSSTCHRAQGGQWDGVVVYIDSARWITREWLLTALSRAVRQLVVVVRDGPRTERVLAHARKARDRISVLGELVTSK